MADVPFMDEERGAEEARQRAFWALASGKQPQPLVDDQEVTPQQVADRRFAESPFGWIDKKLKGAEDWVKGRVAKRQEPFKEMIAKGEPGASHLGLPDPVELGAMMGVGGLRTANRWLYGTKDPSQLRDEDLLGPLGMSAMGAPFAAMKHGVSLGSAGGKLAGMAAPFARKVDDLGYYSKLDEVLGTLKPTDTVTMDTLAKRGVKAAEIEARGLSPFIADGKGAKVGDLQKGAQPVQVKETKYNTEHARMMEERDLAAQYRERGMSPDQAAIMASRVMDKRVGRGGDPKWRDYATDGDNPSYHEGVLHLPTQLNQYDAHLEAMRAKYADQHGNGWGQWPMTAEERAKLERLQETAYGEAEGIAKPFRSGHWDEPNAIAHYRASMQPTEGGGKAYLIDELQSDWGQKLRDGGVRDEAKIAELRKRVEDNLKRTEALVAEGRDPKSNRLMREQEWLDARKEHDLLDAELRTAEAATPGNPFVNTSEQWMTTALRRMMRNAAEQQADGIAITPGAVHNERFGLSNHVSGLRYNPDTRGLQYKPPGEENSWYSLGGREVAPDKLPDYVGKEMAEKMLAQPREGDYGGWHTIDHLGSQEIGGEGMKYAYDKILPKLLSKELSRLDPSIKKTPEARWREHQLLSHGTNAHLADIPFHHFPLTPKAREEIMKGLPLFNAPGGPEAIAEALRAQQQLQTPFTQDE